MLGICLKSQVARVLGVAAIAPAGEPGHQVEEVCLCFCAYSEPSQRGEIKHFFLMWGKNSFFFAFDYALASAVFSKAS